MTTCHALRPTLTPPTPADTPQNFYASIPGIRKGMLYYPLEEGALVHVDMEDVGKVRLAFSFARSLLVPFQGMRLMTGAFAVNCGHLVRSGAAQREDVQPHWRLADGEHDCTSFTHRPASARTLCVAQILNPATCLCSPKAATINMKAQVPCTYESVPDEVAAIAFQVLLQPCRVVGAS